MNHFSKDPHTAFDAKVEAQRIAFAPIVFQTCRVLRDTGILERLRVAGKEGLALDQIVSQSALPRYGVKVLMEAGLGIGLFCLNEERYTLANLGYIMLRDEMTRVNMDVVHDVCYRGFFDLEQAIREGRPAGLKSLGDWPTLYEGLASFSPKERQSWLAFDHFYSDHAFPAALPLVFAERPKRLLDVGGNTGKWAILCARHDPDVQITIADLPPQLELARAEIRQHGLEHRVDFHPINLLDDSQTLPAGYDVVWMSQFLDCFSEREIVSILQRTVRAMTAHTTLNILELFWDRQPNAVAAFCLQQTSLYFACIANGNSQMYHSADLLGCLAESGLKVIASKDEVGAYHTLLQCRKG
jgi:2-polyprenyl-3-methyl-5-hydroxy-6-metoxy-1,4-benzoquinol methylase